MKNNIQKKIKIKNRIAVVLLLLCPFYFNSTINAQEKRPMTIIDFLEVPSLSDPQLSPNGKQVVYTFAEADWKANKMIGHIWKINVDGTGLIQLTNGVKGEKSPAWSPDGQRIAFLANRSSDNKKQQIFIINSNGGEAQQLSDHPTSVSNIQWSPDGKFIYFLAYDPKTEDELKKEKLKDDVIIFDEDYKQRHLWKISLIDKSEQRISEGDYSVLSYNLSADGSMISYRKSPSPLIDNNDEAEVWIMNFDGTNPVQITNNSVQEYQPQISPDKKTVLFLSDSNEEFELYYNDNIFLANADGSNIRMLLKDMPYEVKKAAWSYDGKMIYFAANTGVRIELFQYDIASEKLTQLTKGDHSISNWSYVPKLNKHIFTISNAINPGDVWILENDKLNRVTYVFDYLDKTFALPRQEAIIWKGEDGVTVEGIISYPLGYEKGKKYPLVVNTHGGPASSSRFGFSKWGRYLPILNNLEYIVLKPNYRGSTGYGDNFLRDMIGHYFNQAHLDVMAAVDHLINLGIADGDKLVKMGWSAGGHMTNKIITYTQRFKAASSGAGAFNWISMYAQSDVRINRTPWFGGTPWGKDAPLDIYMKNSPLSDASKITTPTIVLVGQNDVRVPPPQSVELYRALESNGVPTHLYIAPREPHGWKELRHRLFKINVEIDWFEKYAMNREYKWVEAPEVEKEK